MKILRKHTRTTTDYFDEKNDFAFSIIENLHVSKYDITNKKSLFDVVFSSENTALNQREFSSKDEIFSYINELSKKQVFVKATDYFDLKALSDQTRINTHTPTRV